MNHAKDERRRMSLGQMENVFTSCSSVRGTLSIWVGGWLGKGDYFETVMSGLRGKCERERLFYIGTHSESSVEPCEMG